MKVAIPGPLHAYTGGVPRREAGGATLDAVLRSLDARLPGIRFRIEQARIRPHLRPHADGHPVAALAAGLSGTVDLLFIAALSGA